MPGKTKTEQRESIGIPALCWGLIPTPSAHMKYDDVNMQRTQSENNDLGWKGKYIWECSTDITLNLIISC